MSNPKIHCPKCNGTGKRNLPARLAEFYAALVRLGPTTSGKVLRDLGWDCHQTLASHCAERLIKLKLIKKVDGGRYQLYQAV